MIRVVYDNVICTNKSNKWEEQQSRDRAGNGWIDLGLKRVVDKIKT